MPFLSNFLLTFILVLPYVRCHGYVEWLLLDGKNITSYLPYDDPEAWARPPERRITRAFANNGPIEDVSSVAMACNSLDPDRKTAASPANYSADVTAGSTVEFHWTNWPEGHHGPVLTYLSYCGENDCTKFSSTDAKWFKIDEAGYDSASEIWAASVITNTSKWESKIPSTLKQGAYLLRHETIALHSAEKRGGAQFYMQCFQINLKSEGNSLPDGVRYSELYNADDPGLFLNIWWPKVKNYTIPGPALYDPKNAPVHDIMAEAFDVAAIKEANKGIVVNAASPHTAFEYWRIFALVISLLLFVL